MKKNIILLFINLIFTSLFIITLPNEVPLQFNLDGEITSYGSKYMLFITPIIYVLIILIPSLFERKYEISKNNKKIISNILFLIVLFLSFVNVIVLIYTKSSISMKTDFNDYLKYLFVALGFLLILLGNISKNIEPNKYFGFRTPWNFNDKNNFTKTNVLYSKIIQITGLLIFLINIVNLNIIVSFILLIISILIPFIYSIYIFKKDKKS